MTHTEQAGEQAAEKVTAEVQDAAGATRQARFGSLPEPIRLADTFQEIPATVPDPARDTYNEDEWLTRNAL
jgi:hypothetical protein